MTDHSPDHAERAREVLGFQGDRHFAQNIVKHADDPRVSVLASHAIAAMLAYADERVAALRGRDAVGEARAAVARCVEIVRAQQQDFLSEQYATPQPLGSFAERFACGQCMDAIMDEFAMGSNEQRALIGRPSHGEEYRAALNTGDRP